MGKNDAKIKTPDQRLRVFISSTLKELAEERKAARAAVEAIRLIPVMFELGARPHPPKDLYQAYLEQSHIFIGIYWQSYGWIAENEKISGLEDELLLSENFPRLIYVKEPAEKREEKLNHMLEFIRSRANVSYKSFSSTDELSRLIADDIAILISERFYSHADIVEDNKKTVPNNLPVHLPPIIGREKEKSEICELILNKDSHLITITGPGGIGKTRLSLEIGKTLEKYFEDGVYFVDFSGVMDEKNICAELAKAFGISLASSSDITMQIIEFISAKKLLLIIDNFEQLSNSGTIISSIVTRCANLSVIVTSRNPLELSVETEFNIDALTFPDSTYDLNDIEMSPAVMLFCDRARAAYKNFEVNEENIFIISDICRLLGGIPLAIELAAVKVRLFSLEMIKEKLTKKLDLLSGGMKDAPARHKTMRAALEWSYDLLNEQEKKLFRRLSVFVNGFDLEAVESICCDDIEDALGAIESLLTKKFFRKENDCEGLLRFSMMEILRKYSQELFEQSGEAEKIKTNLADYYLRKVRDDSAGSFGAIQVEIPSKWEIDIQNVMEALKILLNKNQFPELIEMIYSLWPVFWIINHDNILEKNIDLQIIIPHDENLSDEMKGKLNWLSGSAAMEIADFETANQKFGIANHFFTLTNNTRGIAWTNLLISSMKNNSGNEISEDEILNGFKFSAKLFSECKDPWGESVALQYDAAFRMSKGNFSQAIESFDASQKIVNKMGIVSIEAYMMSLKAFAYIEMNQYDNAINQLREATEIYKDHTVDEGLAYYLQIISYFLFRVNDNYNAMLVAGLCKDIFLKFYFAPWHMLSQLFRYVDDKVKSLNEGELSSAFDKGMTMNIYKAPELAYKIVNSKIVNS